MCGYPGCDEDHLGECPRCGEVAVEPFGDEFECQACGQLTGLCPDPPYPTDDAAVCPPDCLNSHLHYVGRTS